MTAQEATWELMAQGYRGADLVRRVMEQTGVSRQRVYQCMQRPLGHRTPRGVAADEKAAAVRALPPGLCVNEIAAALKVRYGRARQLARLHGYPLRLGGGPGRPLAGKEHWVVADVATLGIPGAAAKWRVTTTAIRAACRRHEARQ